MHRITWELIIWTMWNCDASVRKLLYVVVVCCCCYVVVVVVVVVTYVVIYNNNICCLCIIRHIARAVERDYKERKKERNNNK